MSEPSIIGLSGLKGSGKDTVAKHLELYYGFKVLSFAGALKDITSSLFSLNRDNLEGDTEESREWRDSYIHLGSGKTPRQLLQDVGVAMRRVDPDIWVNYVKSQMYPCINRRPVVVTDVRFVNEMDMILARGGQIWRIEPAAKDLPLWYSAVQASDIDYRAGTTPYHLDSLTKEHISETLLSLPTAKASMAVTIHNDGTLEQLYQRVEQSYYGRNN